MFGCMKIWLGMAAVAAALAFACSAADGDDDTDTDTGTGGDAGTQGDAGDAGGDGDTDSDADADTDTDFEAPATCEQAIKSKSNIGCEYWAVDLDNASNSTDFAASAQFAVAVANVGDNGVAKVEAYLNNAPQGDPLDLELVEAHDIGEGELYIFKLPRRDVDGDNPPIHKDPGPQTWLSSRAFRITSSIPVVAYQFNPLVQAYSNGASLLLPTSGLGRDYLVLGYSPSGPFEVPPPAPSPANRGYITIVGATEDTQVEVIPTYDIIAGEGIDAIAEGKLASFTIGPFDVINLETRFIKNTDLLTGHMPDLTGSVVRSSAPVAVFFGTDLSVISNTAKFEQSCCAEHLEQQILPSESMGKKFVVSHSAQRNVGAPEEDFYRIMAYSDNTQVTTNLSGKNASFTLNKGKYREFFVDTGFTVTSTGPLHVAQFLVAGGDTDVVIGDSDLIYVPAVDQRRGLYIFCTGKGFERNHTVISMPAGTLAMIDGEGIATSPDCRGPLVDGDLDGVTYEAWTCDIKDGVHEVHSGDSAETAKTPIGVFVYGYYSAGSYAYPAGSDLRQINEDVAY